MSSDVNAIHIENLTKAYRIGSRQAEYQTLRDTLTDLLRLPLKRLRAFSPRAVDLADEAYPRVFALNQVSLTIKEGEVVGLIGHNGAGKTTLMKILAGITEPTAGQAVVWGSVGSLLDIGVGFHQELTGRENIFLYGAILGMRRTEISAKFDDIVAFAEIAPFIETPVKRYSKGMRLRLAFSVAAFMDPDILLVDEVLAVGDAAFQRKCLRRMGEVSRTGRTILFVSHNMTAVKNLCQRVIWLSRGQVVQDGPADEVVAAYLKSLSEAARDHVWPDFEAAPGNEHIRLHRAAVHPHDDADAETITIETGFTITIAYWNRKPGAVLGLDIAVYNAMGIVVFNTRPPADTLWQNEPLPAGLYESKCLVPGHLLNHGVYRVTLTVVANHQRPIYQHDEVLTFEIQDIAETREGWFGNWQGVIRPEIPWITNRLSDNVPTKD
ncbi:MAG: ABC transporter ATP-binding protein [Chloroflexi bacterium]|nr:ABC transporter ATP-binding protein [Chloroflexota bacterium]